MNMQPFPIDDPGYTVITLGCEHRDLLQQLYERCSDFVMLVEGQSVSPDAAEETFQEMPPGRSLEDKFVYGALDGQGQLVGVLEGMRHYPDKGIWWIGLLLLAPEVRGRGLGGKLVQGFEEYV